MGATAARACSTDDELGAASIDHCAGHRRTRPWSPRNRSNSPSSATRSSTSASVRPVPAVSPSRPRRERARRRRRRRLSSERRRFPPDPPFTPSASPSSLLPPPVPAPRADAPPPSPRFPVASSLRPARRVPHPRRGRRRVRDRALPRRQRAQHRVAPRGAGRRRGAARGGREGPRGERPDARARGREQAPRPVQIDRDAELPRDGVVRDDRGGREDGARVRLVARRGARGDDESAPPGRRRRGRAGRDARPRRGVLCLRGRARWTRGRRSAAEEPRRRRVDGSQLRRAHSSHWSPYDRVGVVNADP